MRWHLEQRAGELAGDGLHPDEARLAAQRRFGNVASLQEQARDTFGWGALQRFAQDLRLAARQLTRSPGFSVLAIITLGLGIGANTAMFSMVNGIIYKPLPYSQATELERVYRATPQSPRGNLSPAEFREFHQARAGYGDAAAYTAGNASLAEPGRPADFAYASRCTVNLLSLLGLQPQHGRDFLPQEETPGRDRVVLLSQRVWKNRYGADPGIVGQSIRIDGEPHEVIGVLPSSINDWRHLGMIDFFRPLALTAEQAAERNNLTLRALLRRAPDKSPAEVAGFVGNFGRRLAAEFPDVNAETSWRTVPLQATVAGGNARPMFAMMIALSALVLLIACSNLANLLLARTIARAREFAVRAALGASRLQLLRPLVAESLLLSLAGGACAFLLAVWFRDYMAFRSTGDNGEQVVVEFGWVVFGWALGASLVTAIAFGIAPALFALRLDLNHTLKSGGRGATDSRGSQRFRQVLVVGQFAIAMTLLAAAGVQIRGLNELNNRRAGWNSDHLITGTMLLPPAQYSDAEKINAFHRLALERLGALPGVEAASISAFTPFFNWSEARKFITDGHDRPSAGREPAATVNAVSPGYFSTYGTRVLAGRAFSDHDHAVATKVYVLSESTARSLFGEEDAIGRRIAVLPAPGESPRWGEIVGVVSDVLPSVPEVNPVTNQIYLPMAQEARRQNEIALRTNGLEPSKLIGQIRAAITALDPDLPVRNLQHADLTIERTNYQVAVGRDIFTAMGVLGLALAALGIYGTIARTTAQRAGEFAIRLALGASLSNITRLVLSTGIKLAVVGSLLGIGGALGACSLLALMNPGLRMNSALIVIVTTLLLVGVALLACWLPARRAAKVDAMLALRAE